MNRPADTLGVKLKITDMEHAIRDVAMTALSGHKDSYHIHFVNAYTLSLVPTNPALRIALCEPNSLCFPDGKGAVWMTRLTQRAPGLRQIRGPSFFRQFISSKEASRLKHYFVGGRPEVLRSLVGVIQTSSSIEVVGHESPPFRELDDDDRQSIVKRIVLSGADVVWLGLGTPKQDIEAAKIASAAGVSVIAVGAAFDFYAGALPEAPRWLRSVGLEWIFRLVCEPKRLWRRYLLGNVRFLYHMLK